MFALETLSKRYDTGVLALDGVNAEIAPGEFVALLGPSGCGKSTLLRLLAGLEAPSAGRVAWDGHTGAPAPGEIGFVFQDATLLPWASAAENVYLPLKLRHVARREAAPKIAAALAQVGLSEFAGTRPKGLSGGMRMRVSIARALVSEPILLLMDEPFAALDEFTRHKLQDDLLALWARTGKTIVFVTHSIYEAAYLANRILVMSPRPGRVAADLQARLPQGPHRRASGEYVALVERITACFREIMPT
ncbi:ABC transporter ATP-binding protein [Acidocella sp.]|uniref:ABC transporter ATP-binding protein n=1 Tax=Acidocella sp. TaxID=50710 RepID=UPI00263613C4|nr:ABC transporter ATP-binding protein [Acidocella sp.]